MLNYSCDLKACATCFQPCRAGTGETSKVCVGRDWAVGSRTVPTQLVEALDFPVTV